MEDNFLGDTVNIKREIIASIDYESIIGDFKLFKDRNIQCLSLCLLQLKLTCFI